MHLSIRIQRLKQRLKPLSQKFDRYQYDIKSYIALLQNVPIGELRGAVVWRSPKNAGDAIPIDYVSPEEDFEVRAYRLKLPESRLQEIESERRQLVAELVGNQLKDHAEFWARLPPEILDFIFEQASRKGTR